MRWFTLYIESLNSRALEVQSFCYAFYSDFLVGVRQAKKDFFYGSRTLLLICLFR